MKEAPHPNQASPFLKLMGGLIILALAFVSYWRVIKEAGFVWDDDAMLTANPFVQAKDGLSYIWGSIAPTDYFPLTYTSFWLEWKWWGPNAAGYHFTNVLLHALSCIFFWRALTNFKIPGGWLAALLFCAHPVNVESVAWIAERKNTLAMLFYMMSLWGFARFQNPAGDRPNPMGPFGVPLADDEVKVKSGRVKSVFFYLFSLLAFAAALLSKTSVVMAPFVLLGGIWWLRRKITMKDVLQTVPFFVLSLALGLVTIWFQNHRAIAGEVIHARDWGTRLAGAGWAVWFYLGKAIVPARLAFVYPEWKIDPNFFPVYLPGVAVLGVLALFWKYRKTWSRALLFAFGYFVVMLFPVLGFFDIYFQKYAFAADHWQYFALPAVAALIGGWEYQLAVGQLKERAFGFGAMLVRVLFGGAIVVLFAAMTLRQGVNYKNSERLWTDTLKKNPACWLALNNLGLIIEGKGQRAEAMEHYRQSLQIKPDQAEAHNNIGSAYYAEGKLDEAMAEYRVALKVKPDEAVTHYNIGIVLDQRGQRAEAATEYREALRLRPDYPDAHNNLGCLLVVERKFDEGISHLQEALREKPDYVDALSNLGSTLQERGQSQAATPFLERAIQLNPDHADAQYNYGNTLLASGRAQEAVEHYQAVLKLKPEMTSAVFKLGSAFLTLGRLSEALACYNVVLEREPDSAEAHFQIAAIMDLQKDKKERMRHLQEAVRLKPNWLEALNNLSWSLATNPDSGFKDGVEAVKFAQRAAELTGNRNPSVLDTLGAALARTEQFEDAAKTAKMARELAETAGQTNLAAQVQVRIDLYSSGKAYREP